MLSKRCPGCDALESDLHSPFCQVAAENIRRHGLGVALLTYDESLELVLKDLEQKTNNAS